MREALNSSVQNYLANLTEQPSLVSSDRRIIFLQRIIAAYGLHYNALGRQPLGILSKYILESVVSFVDGSQGPYLLTMKLKMEDGSPHPGIGTSHNPLLREQLLQRGNGVIVSGFPDGPHNNVYVTSTALE